MNSIKAKSHDRYQLSGWLLFVGSALFFIASSIRAGDMIGLMGGLLFLIACIVFLIPVISTMRTVKGSEPGAEEINTATDS
jgi:hypothetical protein